jgi:hypothetical protein
MRGDYKKIFILFGLGIRFFTIINSGFVMRIFLIVIFILVNLYSFAQQDSIKKYVRLPEDYIKTEKLKIILPQENKWKIVLNEEGTKTHSILYVPETEYIDNWTIAVSTVEERERKILKTSEIIQSYKNWLANFPNNKLTILESNDTAKYIWVIFKIETPNFERDSKPRSELFFVRQGTEGLYIDAVKIKEKKFSKVFLKKWVSIFKKSRFIFE